jgi:hypothetical protein
VTAPRPAGLTERNARVVHRALLAGTIVIGAGLVVLAGRIPPPEAVPARGLLRAVVLALVLGGTIALRVLRAVLGTPHREAGREGWWAKRGVGAVALWAVAEGVGLTGAALYVVTRDPLLPPVALGWAVFMLLWYAPGRVEEG